MGSPITGREAIFALKNKSTAWTAAGVQVGADDLIFIDSDGFLSSHAVEMLTQTALSMSFAQDIDPGRESLSGSLSAKARSCGPTKTDLAWSCFGNVMEQPKCIFNLISN